MWTLKRQSILPVCRRTSWPAARVRASFECGSVSCSFGFLQGHFVLAVWAADSLADGVGGEFDVLLAIEAHHFQEIGFAQGDDFLAMRAGDSLAEVLEGEPDMDAASGTRHFSSLAGLPHAVFQPQQIHQGNATAQQEVEQGACHD